MLSSMQSELVFRQPNLPNFSVAVSKQLNNPKYWHIYSKQYVSNGWSEVSQLIERSPIQELQIADNEYPRIIKEIAPIHLPNLLSLSLICNCIVSIQAFISMQCPKLQCLYLSRNHILKVSPLRKAEFPNLKLLIMNDNPIIDFQTLSECNLKKIQIIILEGWFESNVISGNSSAFLKLQSTSLRYIGINSAMRIKESQKLSQLKSKYPKIEIHANQEE